MASVDGGPYSSPLFMLYAPLMERPAWMRPRYMHSDHTCEYSVEQPFDRKALPRYVKSPVVDRYCAICGTKQTLRERLQQEMSRSD